MRIKNSLQFIIWNIGLSYSSPPTNGKRKKWDSIFEPPSTELRAFTWFHRTSCWTQPGGLLAWYRQFGLFWDHQHHQLPLSEKVGCSPNIGCKASHKRPKMNKHLEVFSWNSTLNFGINSNRSNSTYTPVYYKEDRLHLLFEVELLLNGFPWKFLYFNITFALNRLTLGLTCCS